VICYIDTNKFKHQDEWFNQAARIYNILPKHDEFFGNWEASQTADSLRFSGIYFISEYTQNPKHVVCFTVIFPKDSEKHFTIQFNGKRSQYLARKYYLRGSLESEILLCIDDLSSLPNLINFDTSFEGFE